MLEIVATYTVPFVRDVLDRPDPYYMQEKSWASQDIDIALDSSMTRYLRQWSPSGSVKVIDGKSKHFPGTATSKEKQFISHTERGGSVQRVHKLVIFCQRPKVQTA